MGAFSAHFVSPLILADDSLPLSAYRVTPHYPITVNLLDEALMSTSDISNLGPYLVSRSLFRCSAGVSSSPLILVSQAEESAGFSGTNLYGREFKVPSRGSTPTISPRTIFLFMKNIDPR